MEEQGREEQELINPQARVPVKRKVSQQNLVIDLLNDLIVTNRGIINVYHTAVERLEDEVNVELLQGYTEQHEILVAELSDMVVGLSGTPASAPDGSSLVKQAWVTLKAAFTEGDGPVLAAVTQDAEKVLMAYSEAMGEDLPDDVRQLIRQHMGAARLQHEKLSALSAAYNH